VHPGSVLGQGAGPGLHRPPSRSELTTTILGAGHLADLVERMLRTSGRRIDMSTPFVDAMLPDGWRLHVVIPDVTRPHMAVNIRTFVLQAHSLDELVALGTLTAQVARFLEASVAAGLNILVSGDTQAGKTNLVVCPAWRARRRDDLGRMTVRRPDSLPGGGRLLAGPQETRSSAAGVAQRRSFGQRMSQRL
jgi:Type II/IV secretion system protein